jgi:ribosomal protein L30/L7E
VSSPTSKSIKDQADRQPDPPSSYQRETLIGLGSIALARGGVPDTPQMRGMIAKVKHLLQVVEAAAK